MTEDDSEGQSVAFFTLIYDKRPDMRSRAFDLLASSTNEDARRMAVIGAAINEAFSKQSDPAVFSEATKELESFRMTSYFAGIIETAGQVMLLRSAEIHDPEKRVGVMEVALEIITYSMAEGFPVNDETIKLVREAKEKEPGIIEAADFLLIRNGSLRPSKKASDFRRPARRKEPEPRRSPVRKDLN